MIKARNDSLYLMVLGTVAFLLFGFVLTMKRDTVALMDFRTAYYSGQCLLHHGCDPYSEKDIDALYRQHTERVVVPERNRDVVVRNIYLPPAFPFTAPLALLPFNLSQSLWFLLIDGSFVLASFLMWNHGLQHAPLLAGCLLSFCLANSASIIFFGNPAGFVVPLCVLAAWCFVNERWIPVGILSLAIGLAFKPHDAAFIWLYFLLAGGLYRRRALQTLAFFAAFGVPAVLWVAHRSPHFLQELASNLQVFTAKGGMNDPSAGHGTEMLTNLQTVTSFFWANPHVYDLASYLICAPLFIIWAVVTWRSRPSRESAWLALAAIAALSMLPVYHRQYDAKLIILAIPALAMLWARRGKLAWVGLFITATAFVLNGDLPWVLFLVAIKKLHLSTNASYGRLLTAVWDFPVPLSLLAMGIFYLCIYARSARNAPSLAQPDQLEREHIPSPIAS